MKQLVSVWMRCLECRFRLQSSQRRARRRFDSLTDSLEPRVFLSATPFLVSDIQSSPQRTSTPQELTDVNGNLFFAATDGSKGVELWKSDGSMAGTVMVKDINPGQADSNASHLTKVGNNVFFIADDGTNGQELWKSDGTAAGTVLVKDIAAGVNDSQASNLTEFNGKLVFTAYANGQWSVWTSDGTTAGTVPLKTVWNYAAKSPANNLINANGTLYFTTDDITSQFVLWKSDGTTAGTVKVSQIGSYIPGGRSTEPTNVNGTLFFTANDGTKGFELWKSNGTAAGTQVIKDVNPGATGSNPVNLANVNGTLFFSANDGSSGQELWKSDGTANGTVLVGDIAPGSAGSSPANLTAANGTLYFTADDGTGGRELWKSNGTSAGTQLVKEIQAGAWSSAPSQLTFFNGSLYFTANDGSTAPELWKSNGTSAGTSLVKDIAPGVLGSNPSSLTIAGGKLYFNADDQAHGQELWALSPAATAANTTTTLTTSSASPSFGQAVTLTAQIAVTTAGAGMPTSSVTFKDGATVLGTALPYFVNGKFVATFTTTKLAVGSHSLTAILTADDNFATSTSSAVAVTVAKASSTTTLASAGTMTTIAGNGTNSYTGDNGQALAATVNYPRGTAVDSAGNVYIVDTGSHVIRMINKATGVITTIAGNGLEGFSGDNGPATSAMLDYPTGVAVDSAGNVFIADSNNHRIREVVKATGKIITVAGNGTGTFAGDNGPATSASLYYPQTVAVDASGNLFIADYYNQRVREVVKATGNIITVAGNGNGDSSDGSPAVSASLSFPQSVVLDSQGNLFITDTGNNRVRKVVKATGNIVTVAGNGVLDYTGDGGPATQASMYYPGGIAVDASGNLFIADIYNQRIREVVAATGNIITVAGNGANKSTGDNGAAFVAGFNYPMGVTVDSAGNLYISETGRVRKVVTGNGSSPAGSPVTLLATIGSVNPDGVIPTGTVTFKEGSTTLGTGTLTTVNGQLVASFTTTSLTVGSHAIKAIYAGDTNFATSTSTQITKVIV